MVASPDERRIFALDYRTKPSTNHDNCAMTGMSIMISGNITCIDDLIYDDIFGEFTLAFFTVLSNKHSFPVFSLYSLGISRKYCSVVLLLFNIEFYYFQFIFHRETWISCYGLVWPNEKIGEFHLVICQKVCN